MYFEGLVQVEWASTCHLRLCYFSDRQYGQRDSKEVTIEGRVQFDLLQVSLTKNAEQQIERTLNIS